MAAVKETSFFCSDDALERLAEYEGYFERAQNATAIGEFSTDYLAADVVPARIRATIPRVRLLLSLRNPIDQIYSHYWHLARQNFHIWGIGDIAYTFEDAIVRHAEALFAPARYYQNLSRWLEHFDRDQLLIVFYDDIRRRPAEILREVFAFLDVDSGFVAPSIGETGVEVRRGVSPRSRCMQRIHALLYDRLNRRVYYPLKNLLGVPVATRLKDVFHVRQVMEATFFRAGYPPMQRETRALLAERFADEICGIESLTGRDLSHWK